MRSNSTTEPLGDRIGRGGKVLAWRGKAACEHRNEGEVTLFMSEREREREREKKKMCVF